MMTREQVLLAQIQHLNRMGVALSNETNKDKAMENIVLGAMELTHAEGGSLYIIKDKAIHFHIVRNQSLQLAMGGTSGHAVTLAPIPLMLGKDKPNRNSVISTSLLDKQTIRIEDAYREAKFDLSGTKAFDKAHNYHSQSFLTVPLVNHEQEVIGGFQLINARDPDTGKVSAFTRADQHLAESLASQVAIILTQKQLLIEQKELFEAMMALIAKAIDEKSKYTSKHCRRVPELSFMIADAALNDTNGTFKDFTLNEDEKYELRLAAWMHDCGKLSTPEYVMDKATKLECIFDRITLIQDRFEILKRDLDIALLKQEIDKSDYTKRLQDLKNSLDLIEKLNQGGECISDQDIEQLKQIAKDFNWKDHSNQPHAWINDEELMNLCISRGTLNQQEREKIKNHVVVTLKMLDVLPLPKYLRNLPDIAGSHHERIDGSGYPRGLTGDQMTVQDKIIAINYIFS